MDARYTVEHCCGRSLYVHTSTKFNREKKQQLRECRGVPQFAKKHPQVDDIMRPFPSRGCSAWRASRPFMCKHAVNFDHKRLRFNNNTATTPPRLTHHRGKRVRGGRGLSQNWMSKYNPFEGTAGHHNPYRRRSGSTYERGSQQKTQAGRPGSTTLWGGVFLSDVCCLATAVDRAGARAENQQRSYRFLTPFT